MILPKLFSRRGAFLGVADQVSDLLNPAASCTSARTREYGSITTNQTAPN